MTQPHGGQLDGGRVVVTGGNGGIGLGIAHAAVSAGADVVIWARNEAKSARAVTWLTEQGGRARAVTCDVADEDSVAAAMAETVAALGGIDAMVANAALSGTPTPMVDIPVAEWRAVIDTNLTGTYLTFRAAARQMITQGTPGSLVAIASIVNHLGGPMHSHYAATKVGVHAVVTSLATELARHRIRCNSLAPGWTKTDLLTSGFDVAHDQFEQAILRRTPARRWGEPQDYARAAVLLLDPSLSFHTGDMITIDGGYTVN